MIEEQFRAGFNSFTVQWVMILNVMTTLMKAFFFFRISFSFTVIVKMILQCISDLRIFMLFFAILNLMFSGIFDIIGRNDAAEYRKLGPFSGNVMTTFRLSLGDFDFSIIGDDDLSAAQHWLFWIIWALMVLMACLIFLNFIIAEVSASYATVKETVKAQVYKERAGLVKDAEVMQSASIKSDVRKYPRFFVVRCMEE